MGHLKKYLIYSKAGRKGETGTKTRVYVHTQNEQQDIRLKPNSINYYNKCKWTEHSNKTVEIIEWGGINT